MRSLPVGFGDTPQDYDFRFEHKKLGIGLRVTADQPLYRTVIWGTRAVFSIEPFIRYERDSPYRAFFSAYRSAQGLLTEML